MDKVKQSYEIDAGLRIAHPSLVGVVPPLLRFPEPFELQVKIQNFKKV